MIQIDFNDTKLAFQSKTNKDLKRAYFLFKFIDHPFIVITGKKLLFLAMFIRFPVKWIVKPTIFKNFCGGESITESNKIVQKMAKYNVKSILDYSVEGKENTEDIEKAMNETIRSVKNASSNENIPFAVFKPTAFSAGSVLEKASAGQQLNEDEKRDLGLFKSRVDTLCKTAYKLNVPVLIDAEDYCYQNIIDEVVREMMLKYNKSKAIVFNTLQMYRWDRLDFLRNELKLAHRDNYQLGIKFVRGACMEKERARAKKMGYPSPIHPDKKSTDIDYNKALEFSIQNIEKITIFNGTHNEESSEYLVELMENNGIEKNDKRVFFSQLYGMSDHISFNLAEKGYNVAKYLPYGPVKNVLPYLIRRAEENTSVAGQTSRELLLIKQEIKRRKKS